MKKLLLTGLLAVSSLFAIEDGAYKCVALKFCDVNTQFCRKIPLNSALTIVFNVTNEGQKLTTPKDTLYYSVTYKNFDIYVNNKFKVFMPTHDVGNKIFINSVLKGTKQIVMACQKIQ